MFDDEVLKAVDIMAERLGVEAAALLAIAEVESGGQAFATVGGRPEPLIRFEGHYFDQRLTGAKREQARAAGLASPVAGAIANPATQAGRWRLLRAAAAIDHAAAHESVSWGLGQIMGAHWRWLGFPHIDAFVAEARSGIAGQITLMCLYVEKAGLVGAIRRLDWAAFARAYNGPAYAKHGYHTKIAATYERYRNSGGATKSREDEASTGTATPIDTVDLQRMLSAADYPVEADGLMGPLTRKAIRGFQADSGLDVDGIPGPKTLAALRRAIPFGAGGAGIWNRVVRFLAALFGRS